MLEVISLIALLCQVHPAETGYHHAKMKQNECQQTLVMCVRKEATQDYGERLSKCIIKGGY